jgi:hypothetical protein
MTNDRHHNLQLNQIDFNIPFDHSIKTLNILMEAQVFLKSNCVLSLFKKALKKTYLEKKFSIYLNFYSNKSFNFRDE